MQPPLIGQRNAQRLACQALAVIAARKEENEVIIAAAGGIECIIAAAMHSVTSKDNENENIELQLEACVALYNLAHQDDLKIKIATAGGVECMLAAMRRHTTRADVQVKYITTKKNRWKDVFPCI